MTTSTAAVFPIAAATAACPAFAQAQALASDMSRPEKMRHINEIIVHCSATPAGRDVTTDEIRRWHLRRGFRDVGYHFVVRLDGTIEVGRPLSMAGAHCIGHNANSIGVCYVGGCDSKMTPADTRTAPQREAMVVLLSFLRKLFPGAAIHSHRDFANKACPSFDATSEYSSL